ncbi:Aflatoxin B1 aldehyde reductase member 3 [Mycena sanguinolenta]|uniref:Aflatoxin B1 aldehyde reductase member 3 n=1 Tax=Mycena sanguinolenta TaxID=230812 RepID=A0A8H6Y9Z3_9AGAR|nr:Aflatoxin B1 aldehyde reductase member 3 [Mycena sanguinolenta]
MSTANAQKSALNVILGTMTVGEPGTDGAGARVDNVQDIEKIFDVFVEHGHSEVREFNPPSLFGTQSTFEIDTARAYCAGTSEVILGKTNWQKKGILVVSKLYPLHPHMPEFTGPHTPEGLRKALMASLKALKTDKLEIWYLHGPDRSVPYEVTLKAIDELYREGHFKRFGISNYMSPPYTKASTTPSTASSNLVEPELFPALRKFGISFYGFNPLAGGFFTDRYTSMDAKAETGSRYDPERFQGKSFRGRYWKTEYFDALAAVRTVASTHGLTVAEVALRWVSHHSLMRASLGDSVIIGGSSLKHVEENLVDLEKGPLPDEVVAALDEAWAAVKSMSSSYYY